MDLHPYDGIERRFRNSDVDNSHGYTILKGIFSVDAVEEALYDLSFYSGGIGVLDKLGILIPASFELWASVLRKYTLLTPELSSEENDADAFVHLIGYESGTGHVDVAARNFVEEVRHDFQQPCTPTDRLFFTRESDVNDWTMVWGNRRWLNFSAFSQG